MSLGSELLGLAAMAGLWMLGVTRLRSMLWGLSVQSAALAGLLLTRWYDERAAGDLVAGIAILAVKAVAIPWFLNWAAVRLEVARDKGAGIAPGLAMLIGAGILAACYFQSGRFSATGSTSGSAGLAIAVVLTGLTLMMGRRLALGMLIGLLVLDNGIFAYAVTETSGLPIAIELAVLFDLFIGVLLAGMVLFRVRRSFEHLDVSLMRELKE